MVLNCMAARLQSTKPNRKSLVVEEDVPLVVEVGIAAAVSDVGSSRSIVIEKL
jgi:hypothetical protein